MNTGIAIAKPTNKNTSVRLRVRVRNTGKAIATPTDKDTFI
jgi:hypothetical protein